MDLAILPLSSLHITQNSLYNNISTKMYLKSKTKQYLLIIALTETALIVINYVMLTCSVKTLWMAIYSIVGPTICQVSVHHCP